MPSVLYDAGRYAYNRAGVSHQPARQRERQMRRLKSASQLLNVSWQCTGVVLNLFRLGRHRLASRELPGLPGTRFHHRLAGRHRSLNNRRPRRKPRRGTRFGKLS